MKRTLRMAGWVWLGVAMVLLGVWLYGQRGQAKLSWQKPEVKRSVHSFAYKVYANSHLSDGRFFLSKIVFKNEGSKPVRDFSISYQIPGYIAATTPEELPEIPPGHTVVKLFYPQFPREVAKIKERTIATLEIKLQWKEGGKQRDDLLREEFTFRGVNELVYTDLPAEEQTCWQDLFLNADLLAAMVTPNDPVVAAYSSEIVASLGGAVAGAGGAPEALEMLKGTYDYMMDTGLQYAGGKGVPESLGDVSTTVQTIRLPRDTIRNNNGLCIELALLWASVMEHVGIRSELVLRPGHAYICAPDFTINSRPFTVECTAITPKSVGKAARVNFSEAVAMSQDDFEKYQQAGNLMTVDIQGLQTAGIVPPELPEVDIEELKATLASRKHGAALQTASQARPSPTTPVREPANPNPSSPATTPQPTVSEPPPNNGIGELTAFQLIKVGDRYVNEKSKDRVVEIRSDKSVYSLTPAQWEVTYYAPDTPSKTIGIKFLHGQQIGIDITRRMEKLPVLDPSVLRIDSDQVLQIIQNDPAFKLYKLSGIQYWLLRDQAGSLWRVRLWASPPGQPGKVAEMGDIYISSDAGTVVRRDIHF